MKDMLLGIGSNDHVKIGDEIGVWYSHIICLIVLETSIFCLLVVNFGRIFIFFLALIRFIKIAEL